MARLMPWSMLLSWIHNQLVGPLVCWVSEHGEIVRNLLKFLKPFKIFWVDTDVVRLRHRGPRLCVETSDNVDEALDALLEEAKPHVVDFLSDRQVPGRKPQAAASIRKQLQDL